MKKLYLCAVLPFAFSVFAQNPVVLDDGIEIVAIEEVAGRTMDISLFDGKTLSKEQKLALMPDGKAPASVNVFLVKIGTKTYLIDVGFGNAVKDKRIDPSKIDAVLITHEHGDHVSGLLNDNKTTVFSTAVFISKKENDYWLDPKTENSQLQKDIAAIYKDNIKTFTFGDTIVKGIVAVDASGHTAGHTAFLIGTGKKKMLIAGDFLHAAALQFPHPDESAQYDTDKNKAAQTRKTLMKTAEDNGWLIAGIHIPMPGYGKVKSNGKGGFEFLPSR
jgi:glyoxylase-like metal-dependent hydrolase (beta-lactamase superfamily II)